MNIQFFNPPVHHYSGIRYKMLPTLSLPTLAAWFNRNGHYAEAVDLEALEVHPRDFLEKFRAQSKKWPDVIGVTGLSIAKRGMREILQAIREAGFTGRVMAGGVYMTLHPEDGLAWGADLVVTGECEGNILQLVESGATGIHRGQPAAIEDIPVPDWTHFRPAITTYESNIRLLLPLPGISMWARGCPYGDAKKGCTFCGNVVFGGKPTRYRPPQNVEADMLNLKAMGVRNVYVYDDELVGGFIPDGWMREIADRIAPLGLAWLTQGRCSKRRITPELMREVRRARGHTVFWGVESFSQKVLNLMQKHTTVEDIWHTLRTSREAGVNNAVFTMIGNYGETDEDLAETCAALAQAYREGLIQLRQTTICTPMEGTELARRAEAEGWYTPAPDFGPQMLQHSPTPWLSVERMLYWQQKFAEACPVGLHELPAKSTTMEAVA